VTKTCRQIRRLAGRYVDEELTLEEQRSVSQHVPVCPECAAAVQRQRLVAAVVATLPRSAPSAAVRTAVLAGPPARVSRRLVLKRGVQAMALGGVTVLGVAALARIRGAAMARRTAALPPSTVGGQQVGSAAAGQAAAQTQSGGSAVAVATGVPSASAGAWVKLSGPRIAFVGQQAVRTGSSGQSTLWLTSLAGGPAISMAQRNDTLLGGQAWSVDGARLFFIEDLWTVMVKGLAVGANSTVYSYPRLTNGGVSALRPGPDGRSVAVLLTGGMETPLQLHLLDIAKKESVLLHQGGVQSGLALVGWQAGTGLLLYQEAGALWALNPSTRSTTLLQSLPASLGSFSVISPDTRQALQIVDLDPKDIGTAVRDTELVVVDLTTGASRNLTNGFAYNVGAPSWSSDGAWIAFTTSPAWQPGQPQPARDLWIMRADGSGRRNLTQGKYASVAGAAAVWTPLPEVAQAPTATATAATLQGPVPVHVLSEDRAWYRPDPLQMAQTVWQDKRYTQPPGVVFPLALSFYTHHFLLFTMVTASGASHALDITGLMGAPVGTLGMDSTNTALMAGREVVVWVFGYTVTAATIAGDTLTLSVQPNITIGRGYAIIQVPRPVTDHWLLRCVMGTQEVARTVVDARQGRADPLDEAAPDVGLPPGLPRPEEGHVLVGPSDYGELNVQTIGGKQQVNYVSYLALVAPGTTTSQVAANYATALRTAGFRVLPVDQSGTGANLSFHGIQGTAAADLALGVATITAPVPTTGGKTASGTAQVGLTFSYATGPYADAAHPLLVEGTITVLIPERGLLEVRSTAGQTFPIAWASGALVAFPDGRTAPLPATASGAWPTGLSIGAKVRAGGQRWLAATSGPGAALLAVWIDVQP
jgi:hypothetical protein